jgi:hypothetical protein
MTKRLKARRTLELALAGVAVLEALDLKDAKMTYGEFARAIGLLGPDDAWEAWHPRQVSSVLYLIGALNNETGDDVNVDRLVNAATGKPGGGLYRDPRIVIG